MKSVELILKAFAFYFLALKEEKNYDCEDYKVLKAFWKEIELYPTKNKDGVIVFSEWKKKKEKKENKTKDKVVEDAEKNLINDIFFDFEKEVIGIMKIYI